MLRRIAASNSARAARDVEAVDPVAQPVRRGMGGHWISVSVVMGDVSMSDL